MKKQLRSRNKNSGGKGKSENYTLASSKKHQRNRPITKKSQHPPTKLPAANSLAHPHPVEIEKAEPETTELVLDIP